MPSLSLIVIDHTDNLAQCGRHYTEVHKEGEPFSIAWKLTENAVIIHLVELSPTCPSGPDKVCCTPNVSEAKVLLSSNIIKQKPAEITERFTVAKLEEWNSTKYQFSTMHDTRYQVRKYLSKLLTLSHLHLSLDTPLHSPVRSYLSLEATPFSSLSFKFLSYRLHLSCTEKSPSKPWNFYYNDITWWNTSGYFFSNVIFIFWFK